MARARRREEVPPGRYVVARNLADVQQQREAVRADPPSGQLVEPATSADRGLALNVTLYTVARLGMLAVIAAVLLPFGVPLLVALAVAVVVSLPLSFVVLRALRQRVAAGLAERSARRKARRAELRAQLRGERDAADREPAGTAGRADSPEPDDAGETGESSEAR